MRIASLKTKDGATVPLGKLTVLVGPNNVGKSRTLRDIHELATDGASAATTLISSVAFQKPATFDDLLEGIEQTPSTSAGHIFLRGIGATLRAAENHHVHIDGLRAQFAASPDLAYTLGNIARLHVSFLDASSRLLVAQQSPSHNRYESAPSSLLQALFVGRELTEDRLRAAFKATFNLDIRLDYGGMQHLMLRVAEQFPEIPADPRLQGEVMQQFLPLDTQGDGFRSFVGVVLSVLLTEGRTILLDEPEAFLHPMQARRLGNWLARQVADGSSQVVVATHNASFLAGVLAANQQVDLYRLNRTKNTTTFRGIAAAEVKRLALSPLLSSQRVLEAIFHRGVVVCEADGDRAIYEGVAVQNVDNREVLFVHAHNKQTIHSVVALLRDATIPVCAAVDIDILNSASDLETLLRAFDPTTDATELLAKRKLIGDAVEGRSEAEVLSELLSDVQELASQLKENAHNLSGARGALSRVEGRASKWSKAKREGVDGLPEPVRNHAQELLSLLAAVGIFVVPVGELEGWIKLGITKKNKWIVKALDEVAGGTASAPLQAYVKSMIAFLDTH